MAEEGGHSHVKATINIEFKKHGYKPQEWQSHNRCGVASFPNPHPASRQLSNGKVGEGLGMRLGAMGMWGFGQS